MEITKNVRLIIRTGDPINAPEPVGTMPQANLKTDTLLATPPVAVVTATLAGIPVQEWVYILTALYTLFLIGEKLFKWWKAWQERKIFQSRLELPPERKE